MTSTTPSSKSTAHAIFRAISGLLILGSVVWQVTDRLAHGLFRGTEYFSFVTVQSSLLAGVLCIVGAFNLWKGKTERIGFGLMRLSITGYAVIVAVVYNLLLRGVSGDVRDAGYDWPVIPNEILHVWGPVLIVVDWLISQPGAKIKFKQISWVLLYPVLWIGFTIVRGYVNGWWPYPFLDPTQPAGVAGMVTYIAVIIIFLSITSLGMIAAVKALHRNRHIA